MTPNPRPKDEKQAKLDALRAAMRQSRDDANEDIRKFQKTASRVKKA